MSTPEEPAVVRWNLEIRAPVVDQLAQILDRAPERCAVLGESIRVMNSIADGIAQTDRFVVGGVKRQMTAIFGVREEQ